MSSRRRSAFHAPYIRGTVRRLAIVLGDQLDKDASLLTKIDKRHDAIVMMEVQEESTHVASHKQRTALFFSAMRHFALQLKDDGFRIHYVPLTADQGTGFAAVLRELISRFEPASLLVTEPGEWRVCHVLEDAARACDLPIEFVEDTHFLVSRDRFASWMEGRKQPIMEHFYRSERKRLGILMNDDGSPIGNQWNFDKENRKSFKQAPRVSEPYTPRRDDITDEVLELVEERFADHPGSCSNFRWPVTRVQALRALDDFVERRLPGFGTHQDAMWEGEPFLNHSLLSPCINLKLLHPLECVSKALKAYESGHAPLNSVEAFVRQIIGWREFIRGIYWHEGPAYGSRNELGESGKLPWFYWTADTSMACMKECIGQVLDNGFGHHIQRLMVTGNFALISGIDPRLISDWYLAMYVDAVDWVTLPNTLGMVMHADGGVVGTKPYAASGKYISRMSNYCKRCPLDPEKRSGESACPFTVFYWDFLLRHRGRFEENQRMAMMLKNLDRFDKKEVADIKGTAQALRDSFGITPTQEEG